MLGFVGRLCDQKAPLDFIATARQVLASQDDVHAVMVGTGPMQDEVLRAAADLPAGRFHHLVCDAGAEHMPDAFDVLLTTSTYEGGPYLPLEAMRAGVPVVASDCAGLCDYVVNNVSGLTVTTGDVAGYTKAVLRVLADEALRVRLKRSALTYVQLHHDIALMARSYEELYLDLAPGTTIVEMPRLRADLPSDRAVNG